MWHSGGLPSPFYLLPAKTNHNVPQYRVEKVKCLRQLCAMNCIVSIQLMFVCVCVLTVSIQEA